MGISVQDKDFEAAAALAFELGHQGRLLSVVESALAQGADSAQAILGGLVRELSPERLKQCLEYARDWNTNSRRCHAAQAMLQAIVTEHTPEVVALPACCSNSTVFLLVPDLNPAAACVSCRVA